jgi:hypothetical protein
MDGVEERFFFGQPKAKLFFLNDRSSMRSQPLQTGLTLTQRPSKVNRKEDHDIDRFICVYNV